MIIDQQILI